MNIEQVSLSDIDLSSKGYDRFLFSYERDLNAITDSISKVGLINPVTLTKNQRSNETYTIVCGSQRIKAYQKLGIRTIESKALEGLNDEELLLLSFHDNLFSRGFNEIEKALVIKKFPEIGYSYDRVVSEITPLLDLPPNRKILGKYLSLLKLAEEIKNDIAINELELEKAVLLMQLDDADRKVVYRILFKESCTNLNETKETIRNILDLKLIKQKGINELLTSNETMCILSDSKINKRQKGERIYKIIKTMRYPAISEKEEEFNKSCRELGLDNHVRINHSRYFEGDDIRITIKTTNEEKLKTNIEKLMSNINNGAFKKIFSIYKS